MSALAEALVAAQRRAVAAMEKSYVAGSLTAERGEVGGLATGAAGLCPVCNTPITLDGCRLLLPHHPGVNAGTPRGGNALCKGTNERSG